MSAKCGTYAGYSEHTKFKTEVCGPCRKAATDYNRERRRKTGQTTRMLVDLPTKRFTDAELAAEIWKAESEAWASFAVGDDGKRVLHLDQLSMTLQRFANCVSYDEVDS